MNSADGNTFEETRDPLNDTLGGQDQPSKDRIGVPDFHSSGIDEKKPWGLLEARHFYYKTVEIAEESFTFGRMHNEHLMNQAYIPAYHFDNTSRKHFTIKKNGDEVTITDHSHWGTFIKNSKFQKIGKGRTVVLENDNVIHINKPHHECFKFRLLSLQDSRMMDENLNASQRSGRGTPRKLSPSSVNESNLVDGKRTRRPK